MWVLLVDFILLGLNRLILCLNIKKKLIKFGIMFYYVFNVLKNVCVQSIREKKIIETHPHKNKT